MTARSNGDGSTPHARAGTFRSVTSARLARGGLAVGAIALAAVVALPAADALAAAARTLTRDGAASGGPGSHISYTYIWQHGCPSLSSPVIVLTWDDTAHTIVGTVAATPTKARCQGIVPGVVPSNATAGLHTPSAYLRNDGGTVPNTGAVAPQDQGFTVILPPTPAPTPTPTAAPTATPTPTPTDTPLPTDTPTALPSESPTSTPSDSSAIPAGNGGSSTPPGALVLVGIVAVLVLAAATAGAVLLARRRRPRPRPNQVNDDPFQFLR